MEKDINLIKNNKLIAKFMNREIHYVNKPNL